MTESIIFRKRHNFGIISKKEMSTAKAQYAFFFEHNLPKPIRVSLSKLFKAAFLWGDPDPYQ